MNITTPTIRPEFFRLPKRGEDPHFGFTRSFYYELEKRGDIRLHRIRARGKKRGVTSVEYDQMSAFMRSQNDATTTTPVGTAAGGGR